MTKKSKPAHELGTDQTGELPEETKNAIETAVTEAETRTQEQAPEDVQALRNEVEKLRAQVARAPQSLEDQISYFQRKQQLVTRLQGLNVSIRQLEQKSEEILKEAEEDVFSSENYALKLAVKKGYSSEEDVFKFRNPAVIYELLNYVLGKMYSKREAIEEEITA